MRKLKVFGISIGMERGIIAVPNKAAAAKAFHLTPSSARAYCSQTWVPQELKIALADPGVPYFAPYNGPERGVYGKLRGHERASAA